MPTHSNKRIWLLLLIVLLTVALALIPEVIGESVKAWCKDVFGDYYIAILGGVLIIGTLIVVFLTTDVGKAKTQRKSADKYNIPVSAASRTLLQKAKIAVQNAEPEQALQHLGELKLHTLDADLSALNARLSAHERTKLQGIQSTEAESRSLNRLNRDILALIATLEKELAAGTENYQTIKAWLKQRYERRLGQKLAGRQPVNLRRLPSTEGNSEETIAAFVSYGSDEIRATMAQTFWDAHGRLLVVGAPGAGKTTLLLQLVLDLLQSEPDALPVLLNLATWKKEYASLEGWLAEILPAELGVSKRYAAEIIQQNRLILLLDGLDEVFENDRTSCLEAIGRYGADAGRRFVISSRKEEYKQVSKDAPVFLQIEVGLLTIEQVEAELERIGYSVPEAKPLLVALGKDELLREAVETPFYFNTVQLLFANAKRLSDLKFSASTKHGREEEIIERFVEHELDILKKDEYSPEQVRHWLSFFASRLNEHQSVVFELEDLQFSWWKKWSMFQIIAAAIIGWLVFGIFNLLTFGVAFLKSPSLAYGLVYGSLIGLGHWILLSFNRQPPQIFAKKTFYFSVLLHFGHPLSDLTPRIRRFAYLLLLFLIIDALMPRMDLSAIQKGICYSIVLMLLDDPWEIYQKFLIGEKWFSSSPYQSFIKSAQNLHFSIFQHLHLRWLLFVKGLLPLRLVDFLNEMSARHLLETDGASWRFRHRLLQDYFAGEWKE